MGSHGAEKIIMEGTAVGSETTIEIKIKTLDSQTYTLRVNKQMPVPALKEQIASVTGVLSDQQRLICRGKVLKDDQLLSAYHVEDGHTLHMVVRQPIPPSADSGFNHSADPTSGSSRSRVSPNVVIETFSMPDQGEGVPPEIGQIVSAILGSFGFPNVSSGSYGTDVAEHGSQRSERAGGAGLTTDSSQHQPGQASTGSQTDRPQSAFGIPSAVPLESVQPPVLPDSFTTLSQYLSRLKQDFGSLFRGEVNDPQAALGRDGNRESTSASNSATAHERLPTLASLAELLLSTRLLLVEQVGERVNQLASQLVDQGNVTEAAARAGIQSNTWRTGVLLHNLGSLLLELGRTTMTARLGQAPTEAVVNAGPAVFISPTGPNPIMVQPLPLQPGGFGAIPVMSAQPSAGLINGLGSTFLPRRIDIQIRRATPNTNREEGGDTQQPAGQRTSAATGSTVQNSSNQTTFGVSESTLPGEPGVRVVPIRTVVATIPTPFSPQSSDSQSNNRGLHYPVLGRSQLAASEDMNINQAMNENLFDGIQTELPPVSEVSVQQQNPEADAADGNGSSLNPTSRQQRPPRSIGINVLTASGMPASQESERQMPNSFLQLLRTVFPGADLTTEETNSEQLTTQPAPENASASSGATPESGVTEEGIFLSNLLTQIIPVISQHTSIQDGVMPQEAGVSAQAENSNAGTSRRPDDSETSPPNSKRQKVD